MKNKLFLSLAAAAVIGLAGVSATAMADPQVNNGMPGIVMSGSQNYREVLLFDFSDWRIETEPH